MAETLLSRCQQVFTGWTKSDMLMVFYDTMNDKVFQTWRSRCQVGCVYII